MAHYIGRRTLVSDLFGHEIHIWCHMLEEPSVTLAELIQARFAVSGESESVFGTFTVAGKEEFAAAALAGEG